MAVLTGVARQHGRHAWWRVAVAVFTVAYGTNVFTPLLVIYRRELELSATAVTAIFASYAAGLLPALLLAGPASDRLGRRRLVLPFAALAGGVSLLFLPAAQAAPLLFLARFLQGLVSGVVFSVGSAWLADLTGKADVAGRRTAIATTAGFSLGPLLSGLLGQYAPWPTTLPFLVHVALIVTGLALLWPARDVLTSHGGGRITLRLPDGTRTRFWLVLVPTAIGVFGFPSTAATVLPLLLPPGGPQTAQAGVIAGITLGVAALVAPASRLLRGFTGASGAALGAAGLAVTAIAGVGVVPVLVAAAVLLGTGSGLTLTAGLSLAQRLATDTTRGALNSAFYAWAYAGFALPVIITASAAGGPLAPALGTFAAIFGVVAVWLTLGTVHRTRTEPG